MGTSYRCRYEGEDRRAGAFVVNGPRFFSAGYAREITTWGTTATTAAGAFATTAAGALS